MTDSSDQYRAARAEKATRLRALGLDPYGRTFVPTHSVAAARRLCPAFADGAPEQLLDAQLLRGVVLDDAVDQLAVADLVLDPGPLAVGEAGADGSPRPIAWEVLTAARQVASELGSGRQQGATERVV